MILNKNRMHNKILSTFIFKSFQNCMFLTYIVKYYQCIDYQIKKKIILLHMQKYLNTKHFYIEGILPKGPYPPCFHMADRALLAGYTKFIMFYQVLISAYQSSLNHAFKRV